MKHRELQEIIIIVHLILPLITVVTESLRKGWQFYWEAISDEYTIKALFLTIKATVAAVIVNTIFGLFAAWAITKFHFRGKKILTTLVDIPVTVSPIIAGLIYILIFGRQSILYPYLQNMGIKIVFAVPGIILATIFVTFPFVSRELIPVMESQGTDEEEAIEVADEIIITNQGRIEQKGTPYEVYQNPQTAFTAAFFGQTSSVENYRAFRQFDWGDQVDQAIIRPEFIKISKMDEAEKYRSSADVGTVEAVFFRGSDIEVKIRVNGSLITTRRGLNDRPVSVGEEVNVFLCIKIYQWKRQFNQRSDY